MLMKRDIYSALSAWKATRNGKPLILQGARQTGKTYILKEFGRKEYQNLIFCNFEKEPELCEFFRGNLNPKRLIELLSLYKKHSIQPGKDLLFFDEIQVSNEALTSLKYFNEEAPEYPIVAAGSLLGRTLSKPKSFPVGKVTMLTLYPMTFPEFLDAMGESQYRTLLESEHPLGPLPEPFHNALIELLKTYYFTGGMPEAVASYAKFRDVEKVRAIQSDILKTYALDFAKHIPSNDIPKLSIIWNAVPLYLARENKRFIFAALSKSARARDYEDALRWLQDAGLVHLAHAVTAVEQPLTGFADRSAFKVYLLDVGLMGAMARIAPDILVKPTEFFTTYHGAFVENYVAQQLKAMMPQDLCYWKSVSHKAEVDFILDKGGTVFPLEVKAGINPRSKSLAAYGKRFAPPLALRTTLLNLKKNANILNIPLYAINFLPRFLQEALKS
ncbi:MAG: ATP-binding protein [Fibrobacterota bacterium]